MYELQPNGPYVAFVSWPAIPESFVDLIKEVGEAGPLVK